MNRRDVPFDEAGFEKNRLDTVENVSLLVHLKKSSFENFIFIKKVIKSSFDSKNF